MMFQTLGVGEALIIWLLLWNALDAESSGFSTRALLQAAGSLVPYLIWRCWAFWIDPRLFGKGEESTAKKVI
jgi:hypothetical protein